MEEESVKEIAADVADGGEAVKTAVESLHIGRGSTLLAEAIGRVAIAQKRPVPPRLTDDDLHKVAAEIDRYFAEHASGSEYLKSSSNASARKPTQAIEDFLVSHFLANREEYELRSRYLKRN